MAKTSKKDNKPTTPTNQKITFEDVLRELSDIAKEQNYKDVLLADNLTTGALDGVQEKKFVPVNLSKLLRYIADMMEE